MSYIDPHVMITTEQHLIEKMKAGRVLLKRIAPTTGKTSYYLAGRTKRLVQASVAKKVIAAGRIVESGESGRYVWKVEP